MSDLAALGRAVGAAVTELRRAFAALQGAVDPVEAGHDDAAELIQRSVEVGALGRELKSAGDAHVLAWFRANRHGHRDVVIGELRYFGKREKEVRFRDLPHTFAECARAEIGPIVTAAVGDDDNAEEVFRGLERLAQSICASGGLKVGAVKAVLSRAAEATLPAGASSEDRERVAQEEWAAHLETAMGDALGKQSEPKKLGVANMRFLVAATSDQHAKAALTAMIDRANAARLRALAAEAGGVEVSAPRGGAALCAACSAAAGKVIPGGTIDDALRSLSDACRCEGGCRMEVRPLAASEDGGAAGSWERAARDAGVEGG